MLRSLVGSEMCIRDRYVAIKVLPREFAEDPGFVGRFQQEARIIAKLEHCLLYTSDAADDLPCVDLGGRRIIKKKNNITAPYW